MVPTVLYTVYLTAVRRKSSSLNYIYFYQCQLFYTVYLPVPTVQYCIFTSANCSIHSIFNSSEKEVFLSKLHIFLPVPTVLYCIFTSANCSILYIYQCQLFYTVYLPVPTVLHCIFNSSEKEVFLLTLLLLSPLPRLTSPLQVYLEVLLCPIFR